MSCPKCGCRIVTKLGRARTMLVCADCAQPLDIHADPAQQRRTLLAALSLIGILGLGSTVLLLDSVNDDLRQQRGVTLDVEAAAPAE